MSALEDAAARGASAERRTGGRPSVPLVERLRAEGPTLSVGLFAGDLGALQAERDRLEAAGARLLHLDVADGRFSPLFVGCPALVAATRGEAPLDVHLMVEEPLDCIESVVAAGADLVTIHPESTRHPHRALQRLGQLRGRHGPIGRGVALAPSLDPAAARPLLDECDLLLVLSVTPGWRDPCRDLAARVRAARQLADSADHPVLVSVDGGIGPDSAGALVEAGADVIVAGSAVFKAPTPVEGMAAFAPALARARG